MANRFSFGNEGNVVSVWLGDDCIAEIRHSNGDKCYTIVSLDADFNDVCVEGYATNAAGVAKILSGMAA